MITPWPYLVNIPLKFILILLSVVFWVHPREVLAQSVAINEVMASNNAFLADEDGDYEDWIELYNFGETPVNLLGYGLSDHISDPFKWIFPEVVLEPGAYLLVWASGKDRKPSPQQNYFIPALLREVYTGIEGTTISHLVNHPKFPDNPDTTEHLTQGFEAPINDGDHYGQRVQGYLKAPYTGEYTFWISSDDHGELYLSPSQDPDDAVRIANVPGWTHPRQWDKYPQQKSDPVSLLEGQYYYIMALMKEHEGGDNLAIGWQLPDQTLNRPVSKQYTYWYSQELHTNFRINAEGEELTLTTPQGNTVSYMEPVAIPTDISYGRYPDGTGSWFFFQEPTPGQPNSTEASTAILTPPVFSNTGGFYAHDFELAIMHPDADVQIVYTLDGSLPNIAHIDGLQYPYKNYYPRNPGDSFGSILYESFQSYIYDSPVAVYDRSAEPDKITQISTTWENHPWYAPNTPVSKGITVRAQAYKTGALPSPVVTQTYFVAQDGENPYSLPVFSITIQEDQLFDYYNGIFVAGQVFDNWRTNNPHSQPNGGTPANYRLRGMEQERRANLKYFEASAQMPVLQQDFGLRVHGGWSRAHPMKSIRLYARNQYGKATFDHPFFPDRADNRFKRLLLRNTGNDYWSAYMRDAAYQKMLMHLDFGIQAYQPAVVYINAEYWGLANLRERFDKHYVSRIYDVDSENIDMINVFNDPIAGDTDHFHALHAFIQNNSPGIEGNYQYIQTQMDVSSFMDAQIANIFTGNTDWPANNIRFWRLRTPSYQQGAPKGHDGRWRWLLIDTDFGFGLYGPNHHNTLAFATEPNGPNWPNPAWATLFLRRLLENESFRVQFINRFADLLNTAFLTHRVSGKINQAREMLEPEMGQNIHRWKSVGGSLAQWNTNVDRMIQFAQQRPAIQRTHIRQQFSIPGQLSLTVNVDPPHSGIVKVNTIEIAPSTPGISSDPYPWGGIYFSGIPLTLEAKPASGYRFSHWSGAAKSELATLQFTPAANTSYTAHFVAADPETDYELIHYWHFNNLSGTTEVVSADYSAISQAFITYPGTGDGYLDERGHRLEDPVSSLNLYLDQQPEQGAVLRARNPSHTRELIIEAPTSGYSNIRVAFATTRTTNGAKRQSFHYSTNGGDSWQSPDQGYEVALLPQWGLKEFDLSAIEGVANNPDMLFKILFWGESATGTSGNNRFDNLSVTGTRITTGFNDVIDRNSPVTLYPNPAKEAITLTIQSGASHQGELAIFSMDGRKLKSVAVTSPQTTISLADLPMGIYVMRFSNSYDHFTTKLIRQ